MYFLNKITPKITPNDQNDKDQLLVQCFVIQRRICESNEK